MEIRINSYLSLPSQAKTLSSIMRAEVIRYSDQTKQVIYAGDIQVRNIFFPKMDPMSKPYGQLAVVLLSTISKMACSPASGGSK